MQWEQVAPDFTWDGSYRDIYILGVSLADWQAVWRFLIEWKPSPTFVIDRLTADLPERVETVFGLKRFGKWPMLAIDVSGIQVHCHFFRLEEIQFDLDPREVSGPDRLSALENFMSSLGKLVNRVVVLTCEGNSNLVVLSYSPDSGQVAWEPPPKPRHG